MPSNEVANIAIGVAIVVVICIAITFTILYFAYATYKRAHINNGHEDEKIKAAMTGEEYIPPKSQKWATRWYNFKKKFKSSKTSKKVKESEKPISYLVELKKEEKKASIFRVLHIVAFSLVSLVLVIILIFSSLYRAGGQALYINGSALLTIQTGSMEEVHPNNTYIKENGLTNQIDRFALISVDRVKEESDLNLYDVAAFSYENVIYVHRIIDIKVDEEGVTSYTFRGDANASSLSFELDVKFEQIIGVYNGFHNVFLGAMLTYLQSNIGLISLCAGILFLINLEVQEDLINVTYKKRKKYIASQLDLERKK